MEPRRITEVFAMHGNEMTWEGHLAVVDHLAQWPVDEILDFHDTLIGHLVDGTWTRTSVNRLLHYVNGSSVSRNFDYPGIFEDALVVPGQGHDVAPAVPEGHIGIPLHPWTQVPGDGRNLKPAAVRRAIVAHINSPGMFEQELLLRAAPWAFFRSTGRQMEGVVLSGNEAKHVATDPWCYWARRLELQRGHDRVELVQIYASWTGVDMMSLAADGFDKLVRTRLKATLSVMGEPLRVDGQPVRGLGVPDGQLVWRDSSSTALPQNSLLVAVTDLLTPSKARGRTRLLPDPDFWALMTALGPDHDDWESLVTLLSKKSKAAIVSFHETLAAKLHGLDLPDLFETQDDEMPMSEDVFLYVRCTIVAAGESAYLSVLAARALRQDDWGEGDAEMLLSIASEAFSLRTGDELDHETAVSYETGSNPAWGGRRERSRLEGYSVVSVDRGIREIRFWRTPERSVAVERQRASVAGAIDNERVFGVVDHQTLPISLALSGILFGAAMTNHTSDRQE